MRAIQLVPPPPPKPEIRVNTEIQRMTDEAIVALADDPRNFQRSGQIVDVVLNDTKTSSREAKRLALPTGTPVIRAVSQATICERLSFDARWLGYKNGGWVLVEPPAKVVAAVALRGEWRGMRHLAGIATHPFMRPDGSICQQAGYDEPTGMVYRPNDQYPEVMERPSKDEAAACMRELREVCCDFPFAAPHHESAWIAGVLTSLARPAIEGTVPLFAVDATTRGTGKSRLADAAILLCDGEIPAHMPLSADDEEMRKRITALLIEGVTSVLIDNVKAGSIIAAPCLDALFTADTWSDRVLGSTRTVRVPSKAVWWITGNNLSLGGDLSRRTMHIRLESPLENPEERTDFKHANLLPWVRHERKRLVACALTVLRAAAVASVIPCSTSLWGSFEAWSSMIPPVFPWLDMASALDARATSEDVMDEEKQALSSLIEGLRKLCPTRPEGQQPISARSLVDVLYPQGGSSGPDGYDVLRDAIEAETRTPNGKRPEVRRLGKWLQRVRGRVINGWAIQRHEGAAHTAVWRAEASDARQATAGASPRPT